MAVEQISQIQVRRGFLQDLGQLKAGEFGWAIDQLRLFIGNGTLAEGAPYEGNTEILTSNSDVLGLLGNYRYKGLLGGYQVITDYIRTYQDKIDDFVNVKDFGAEGDGFTDDAPAIQRAINEIYAKRASFVPVTTRRTIWFYPGRYKIETPLILPPYTVFRNAGKDSVIIELTNTSANCVFRTSESTGKIENFGPSSVLGPVEISGITFVTSVNNIPIGIIDSARDISFYRCRFQGSQLNNNPTSANASRNIVINSSGNRTQSVFFSECDFTRSSTLVEISSFVGTSDVKFDRCTFSNSYQGISVSSTVTNTVDLKVSNSVFNLIGREAVVADRNSDGVVSAFNTFLNVGQNYSTSAPVVPLIKFGGNLSHSIADIHTRNQNLSVSVKAFEYSQGNGITTSSVGGMRFGNVYQTIGKSVIFDDNTTIEILLLPTQKTGAINYSIERGNRNRLGSLNFTLDPTSQQIDFFESYNETQNLGVELNVVYNSTIPHLRCAADNSGNSSVITYDVKILQQSI